MYFEDEICSDKLENNYFFTATSLDIIFIIAYKIQSHKNLSCIIKKEPVN